MECRNTCPSRHVVVEEKVFQRLGTGQRRRRHRLTNGLHEALVKVQGLEAEGLLAHLARTGVGDGHELSGLAIEGLRRRELKELRGGSRLRGGSHLRSGSYRPTRAVQLHICRRLSEHNWLKWQCGSHGTT